MAKTTKNTTKADGDSKEHDEQQSKKIWPKRRKIRPKPTAIVKSMMNNSRRRYDQNDEKYEDSRRR